METTHTDYALIRPGQVADAIVPQVRSRLEHILESEGQLQDVLRYLLAADGKMIRPILVSLCYQLCGTQNDRAVVDIATGVELVHMASLVHDDIIDRSSLRRGQETIHYRYGSAVAVLAGDFLFASAFTLFTEWNQAGILQLMTKVIRNMCVGEVDQLVAPRQEEGSYWTYINRKTSSLLGAACRAGAIVSKDPSVQNLECMEQFGINLGYAFQLVDDLLDYNGNADCIGKDSGTDFRQEIWTLPIIRGVSRGLIPANWHDSLSHTQLRYRLTESGLLEDTFQEACLYSQQAIDQIAHYPNNSAKQHLMELADFVVTRQY